MAKLISHPDPQMTSSTQVIIIMRRTLVTMSMSHICRIMWVRSKLCLDVYPQTLLIRMFHELAKIPSKQGTKTMISPWYHVYILFPMLYVWLAIGTHTVLFQLSFTPEFNTLVSCSILERTHTWIHSQITRLSGNFFVVFDIYYFLAILLISLMWYLVPREESVGDVTCYIVTLWHSNTCFWRCSTMYCKFWM